MTDYIKREDAIRSIADHDEFKGERWIKEAWADYMIEDAKPADVEPVRHGRWDVHGKPMPMHDIKGNLSWGNWYVCTGCGFATTAIEGHITQYRYCPNCGAKMDGESDE